MSSSAMTTTTTTDIATEARRPPPPLRRCAYCQGTNTRAGDEAPFCSEACESVALVGGLFLNPLRTVQRFYAVGRSEVPSPARAVISALVDEYAPLANDTDARKKRLPHKDTLKIEVYAPRGRKFGRRLRTKRLGVQFNRELRDEIVMGQSVRFRAYYVAAQKKKKDFALEDFYESGSLPYRVQLSGIAGADVASQQQLDIVGKLAQGTAGQAVLPAPFATPATTPEEAVPQKRAAAADTAPRPEVYVHLSELADSNLTRFVALVFGGTAPRPLAWVLVGTYPTPLAVGGLFRLPGTTVHRLYDLQDKPPSALRAELKEPNDWARLGALVKRDATLSPADVRRRLARRFQRSAYRENRTGETNNGTLELEVFRRRVRTKGPDDYELVVSPLLSVDEDVSESAAPNNRATQERNAILDNVTGTRRLALTAPPVNFENAPSLGNFFRDTSSVQEAVPAVVHLRLTQEREIYGRNNVSVPKRFLDAYVKLAINGKTTYREFSESRDATTSGPLFFAAPLKPSALPKQNRPQTGERAYLVLEFAFASSRPDPRDIRHLVRVHLYQLRSFRD